MPNEHCYKFCFGPWNISEGQDPYGPTTRVTSPFDWKSQLKRLGCKAMMVHEADALPDIEERSVAQLREETGVETAFVDTRLWFGPRRHELVANPRRSAPGASAVFGSPASETGSGEGIGGAHGPSSGPPESGGGRELAAFCDGRWEGSIGRGRLFGFGERRLAREGVGGSGGRDRILEVWWRLLERRRAWWLELAGAGLRPGLRSGQMESFAI